MSDKNDIVNTKVESVIRSLSPLPDDIFQIPKFPYKSMEGSFGLMTRAGDKVTSVSWEGCRDRFQTSSSGDGFKDFLFYHSAAMTTNIVDFIRVVEEIIKLNLEDRIVFKRTNNLNVLYVQISEWWKYPLRRSLLTALLRAGQFYTEHTPSGFEKALYSQYYLAQTKPAVIAFLLGKTASKLKKNARIAFPGWYAHFINKDDFKVRETLTRVLPEGHPKKIKKEPENVSSQKEGGGDKP